MQHPNMDPHGSISAPKITTFQIVKEQKNGDRSIFPRFHRKLFVECREKKISPLVPARWWSQAGSNRRPPACKAGALPAELWPPRLVGLGRVELPTSPLSGVRSNQLSYRPEVLYYSESSNCADTSVIVDFFKVRR